MDKQHIENKALQTASNELSEDKVVKPTKNKKKTLTELKREAKKRGITLKKLLTIK